jgi:hypothetical protein
MTRSEQVDVVVLSPAWAKPITMFNKLASSWLKVECSATVELSGKILYQISLGGSMDEPLDGTF